MFKQTWEDEFADGIKPYVEDDGGEFEPLRQMSLADCVRREIKVFTGTKPENLAKHGMRLNNKGDVVYVDERLSRDEFGRYAPTYELWEESCSIFRKLGETCDGCPFIAVNGGHCGDYHDWNGGRSPFEDAAFRGDPEPMIDGLSRALAFLEKEGSEKEN